MTNLAVANAKVVFHRHLEALQGCARAVLQDGATLSPWVEEERLERLGELWAMGFSFNLTERELVALIYRDLFSVKRGCECPNCREARETSS